MKRRDLTTGGSASAYTRERQDREVEEDEEEQEDTQIPVPTIKILIIGAAKVGKTALIRQYLQHTFEIVYTPTDGYSPLSVELRIARVSLPRTEIKLHIWEAGGQLVQQALITPYYKAAKGVVLVFDPHNVDSCEYVRKARELVSEANACVLVAHQTSDEPVSIPTDMQELSQRSQLKLLIANAKEGRNVDSVFYEVCEQCVQSQ